MLPLCYAATHSMVALVMGGGSKGLERQTFKTCDGILATLSDSSDGRLMEMAGVGVGIDAATDDDVIADFASEEIGCSGLARTGTAGERNTEGTRSGCRVHNQTPSAADRPAESTAWRRGRRSNTAG